MNVLRCLRSAPQKPHHPLAPGSDASAPVSCTARNDVAAPTVPVKQPVKPACAAIHSQARRAASTSMALFRVRTASATSGSPSSFAFSDRQPVS